MADSPPFAAVSSPPAWAESPGCRWRPPRRVWAGAAGRAQRLWQPAGTGQEFFGFRRHLTLLQMVDELRRLGAPCFPHGAKDAGLSDAAEKILDRRFPPSGDHVEINALGKPISMRHRARFAVIGFVYRIDRERSAMREQRALPVNVERAERVPQLRGFLRQ